MQEMADDDFVAMPEPISVDTYIQKKIAAEDTGAGVFGALNYMDNTGACFLILFIVACVQFVFYFLCILVTSGVSDKYSSYNFSDFTLIDLFNHIVSNSGNSLKKRAEDAFADPDWTQVLTMRGFCFSIYLFTRSCAAVLTGVISSTFIFLFFKSC